MSQRNLLNYFRAEKRKREALANAANNDSASPYNSTNGPSIKKRKTDDSDGNGEGYEVVEEEIVIEDEETTTPQNSSPYFSPQKKRTSTTTFKITTVSAPSTPSTSITPPPLTSARSSPLSTRLLQHRTELQKRLFSSPNRSTGTPTKGKDSPEKASQKGNDDSPPRVVDKAKVTLISTAAYQFNSHS